MALRDRQFLISGNGGNLARAHRLDDVALDDDVLPYPEFDDPLEAAKAELRDRFPDAPDSLIDAIAPKYLAQGYLDADIRNFMNDGDYAAAELELGLRQAAAEVFATPDAFRVWEQNGNDWDPAFIRDGVAWHRVIQAALDPERARGVKILGNTMKNVGFGQRETVRSIMETPDEELSPEELEVKRANEADRERLQKEADAWRDERFGSTPRVAAEDGIVSTGPIADDAAWANFTGGNVLSPVQASEPDFSEGRTISFATGQPVEPDNSADFTGDNRLAPQQQSGWGNLWGIPNAIGEFFLGSPAQAQEVRQRQAQMAKIRRGPISGKLSSVLESAARAAGVDVEVISGGQRGISEKGAGRRTGSKRHDFGNAADIDLKDPKTGRKLSFGRKEDRKKIGAFIEAAAAAGATGFGAGQEYMGDGRLHVGFDNVSRRDAVAQSPRTWGSEFRSGGTFRRAFDRGIAGRGSATRVASSGNKDRTAPREAPEDVRIDRSKFRRELANDPELREKLAALMEAEVGSQGAAAKQALVETIMNRAQHRGTTMAEQMTGAYYEPMRRRGRSKGSGKFDGALSRVRKNDELRKSNYAIIDKVLDGSNISNFALHNASDYPGAEMGTAAQRRNPGHYKVIGGETFYTKTGRPGDPDERSFAENARRSSRVASVDPRAGAFGLGARSASGRAVATDPYLGGLPAATATTPFYGTPYPMRFATFGDGAPSSGLPITSTTPAIAQVYEAQPSGSSFDTSDVLQGLVPDGVPDVENDVAMPGAPINDIQAQREIKEAAPISAPRAATDFDGSLSSGAIVGTTEAAPIGAPRNSLDFEAELPANRIAGTTSPAQTSTTASRGPTSSARSAQQVAPDALSAYADMGAPARNAAAARDLATAPSGYTTTGQVVENSDLYGVSGSASQNPRGGTTITLGVGAPSSFEQDYQLEAASRPDYDRVSGRSPSYDADVKAAQAGRAFGDYSGAPPAGGSYDPVGVSGQATAARSASFGDNPFGAVGPDQSYMPDAPTDFEVEHNVGRSFGSAASDARTTTEDPIHVDPNILGTYADIAQGLRSDTAILASIDRAIDGLQIGSFAAPPGSLAPAYSMPEPDSVSSTLGTRTPIGLGVIDVDMGPLKAEPVTFDRGRSQPIGATITDRALDDLYAAEAGGVGRFAVPGLGLPSIAPRSDMAFGARDIPSISNMSAPSALSSMAQSRAPVAFDTFAAMGMSPSMSFDGARARAQDVSPIGGQYNASAPSGSFNSYSTAADGTFGAGSFNSASTFGGYNGAANTGFGGFGDTGISYGDTGGYGSGGDAWGGFGGDPFGGDAWGGGGATGYGGWSSGGGWNDGGWSDSGVPGASLGSSNVGDTGGRASSSGGFAGTGVDYGGAGGWGATATNSGFTDTSFSDASWDGGWGDDGYGGGSWT